jgi:high-affinity Fe2+/Pb2+ permease
MATTAASRSTGSRIARGIWGAIFGLIFGLGLTLFLSQTQLFVLHLRYLVDMGHRRSLALPLLCAVLGLLLGAFLSRRPKAAA